MSRSLLFCSAGALLLAVAGATVQMSAQAPTRPAAPAAARSMPAGNVEHGRYLAEQVAMCVECHSGRDSLGNLIQSQRYLGGEMPISPSQGWNRNWATRAPRNKNLPGYTDEQAMRLLTQGSLDRHGAQLRAPMPRFRMSPQDAADVIAFLRTM